MELLQYYYDKLYEHESFDQIRKIRQLCYDLVSDYQVKMNNDSFGSSPILKGGNVEGDELCEFDKYISRGKKASSHVKTKLDHYLEEDVLPRSTDFDILWCCKLNGLKYPTLQAIARDILVIHVSTVAQESTFSTDD